MKAHRPSGRTLVAPVLAAVIVLVAIMTLVGLFRLWKPVPPPSLVIGVGPPGSSYMAIAKAYALRLERRGVAVTIRPHPRPQDPLAHMGTEGPVAAAFVQGLYGDSNLPVQTLAVIGQEMVWVFARSPIQSLRDLAGLRIASSIEGSSNRLAAHLLLRHAGIDPAAVTHTDDVGRNAVDALTDGRVDAVVHVATAESGTVGDLLRTPGVRLLGVERVQALTRAQPTLRPILIPQGAFELASDLPPNDITAVATMTQLVVQRDMHIALKRALLEVAYEVHGVTGMLERQGQFPSMQGADFPVPDANEIARLRSASLLATMLPYRVAQWAEWWLLGVLPVMVLVALLLRRADSIVAWRADAQLKTFYGELRFLESELEQQAHDRPLDMRATLTRVDALEHRVRSMRLPPELSERWYSLREHIAATRERVTRLRQR